MQWIFPQMGNEGQRIVHDTITSDKFKDKCPKQLFEALIEVCDGHLEPFHFMFYYECLRQGLSPELFGAYQEWLFQEHHHHIPSWFCFLRMAFHLLLTLCMV